MDLYKKFGIIGGDLRQCYLAESLHSDGHTVLISGFDKIENQNTKNKNVNVEETINSSEFIVLPLPISRDGKTLNAPFSENPINLDDNLFNLLKNKKVFVGIISSIKNKVKIEQNFYDYYREDFMVLNAIPTAEGAIKIAIEESKKIINKSNCLVVGYGRIGKVLSNILKNMGANVTVSARKAEDHTWAQINGYKSTNILKSNEKLDFDIIFNTVPAMIFGYKNLLRCNQNTLIIDLASDPGAVDKESAEKLKIRTIQALGLPGKLFPKTAGEITKKIIYKIIEEENL